MKAFSLIAAIAVLTVCLGCKREPTVGDKIRDVGDAVGDTIEDVGDSVDDAAPQR